MQLKMKQIVSAPFQNDGQCLSYSILGVAEDGSVWRYDPKPGCQGWIPYVMEAKVAACEQHNR